jgi:hypothetical protein
MYSQNMEESWCCDIYVPLPMLHQRLWQVTFRPWLGQICGIWSNCTCPGLMVLVSFNQQHSCVDRNSTHFLSHFCYVNVMRFNVVHSGMRWYKAWPRLFFIEHRFTHSIFVLDHLKAVDGLSRHLNDSWFHTYFPMQMEQTECSETLVFKLQMLMNHPEESIQQINDFFACCFNSCNAVL